GHIVARDVQARHRRLAEVHARGEGDVAHVKARGAADLEGRAAAAIVGEHADAVGEVGLTLDADTAGAVDADAVDGGGGDAVNAHAAGAVAAFEARAVVVADVDQGAGAADRGAKGQVEAAAAERIGRRRQGCARAHGGRVVVDLELQPVRDVKGQGRKAA